MKRLLPALAALIIVCYASCRKASDSSSPVVTNIMQAQADALNTLYQYGEQHAENDPVVALMGTADIMRGRSDVANVTVYDSSSMLVTLRNGMHYAISLDQIDANGISLTRGGKGSSEFQTLFNTATVSIKNKDILFYSPPFDQFYNATEYQTIKTLVENSGNGLTLYKAVNTDCNAGTISRFKNYGLVIMSTHGFPWGFMVQTLGDVGNNLYYSDSVKANGTRVIYRTDIATKEEDVKRQLEAYNPGVYDLITSDKLIMHVSLRYQSPALNWYRKALSAFRGQNVVLFATSKFMSEQPDFDNTVIMGNFCYSGTNNNNAPLASGFLAVRDMIVQKSPGAYFGWNLTSTSSEPVDNEDAKLAELQLLRNFIYNSDSTGSAIKDANRQSTIQAHVVKNGFRNGQYLYLVLSGKKNLSYGCGGTITDSRDGQQYKTVCIGNQVWMAENLRYAAPGSDCYSGSAANCTQYGRLYDWNTMMQGAGPSDTVPSHVQGICPSGWHLPSKGEFDILIANFGTNSVAGGALRDTIGWDSPNTGATNASGFNGKPAGYSSGSGSYNGLGSQAAWWTTSQSNSGANYRYYITTGSQYSSVAEYSQPTTMLISCRCVKDY